MRDIILTGFMGTGKTTVGAALARRLGLPFVDTDKEIEARAGRPVAEIIETDGEAAFRVLEHEVLRGLRGGGGRVISTGGGALLSSENCALLEPGQTVFCLTCSPAELMSRLGAAEVRPLLHPMSIDGIQTLLELREPDYARFVQVNTTGKPAQQVVEEIVSRMQPCEVATITFQRTARSTILFGDELLDRVGSVLSADVIEGAVLLVTDRNVEAKGHALRVADSLARAGYVAHCTVLAAGENQKSLSSLQTLLETAANCGVERGGTVIGLGGGVIGDLAGMLAATYMRGVRLVLVPTTLLAQVDAAIGGKVAVDVAGAKNLAGAFHPADFVLIDPSALRTLDASLLSEGLAEVVKIGMVRSAKLLHDLPRLSDGDAILARPDIIRLAAQEKASLVQSDPFEHGDRALLNFGHTIGHAIEAASEYRMSHGRAVGIGMVAELLVGIEEGWSPPHLAGVLHGLLERFALPQVAHNIGVKEALHFMTRDKKRAGERTKFALPISEGRGFVFEVNEAQALRGVCHALGQAT